MSSFRVLSQRTGRMATLAALVVATLGQGLLPALASADAITVRSVALSSASTSASNVSYTVNFTTSAKAAAGAFVIQFCSNTPLMGETCDAPSGMNAAGATTSGGATISTNTAATANKVVVDDTMATSTAVSVELAGITNPSAAGPLYARIATYADDTAAASYSTDGTTTGTTIDEGNVAISITDTVAVSGAVLESMTFCVAGGASAIAANCNGGNYAGLTAPTLKLGNDDGNGVVSLSSANLSTAPLQTQISTNATSGAVISLKSSAAACGGLTLAGSPSSQTNCYIKPSTSSGFTAGSAFFGVKTAAADTDANGTIQPHGTYGASNYYMGFDATHPTAPENGVTSAYGDPILDTDGAPANNKNMQLTFGASVANNTPAGNYSADLSLIATGTF